MAIVFLDEEVSEAPQAQKRRIVFLDDNQQEIPTETKEPVGTSIGQEISQLPAALKQSFGQPLEAIGETAQVAGFPAVGAALKGAIQEPQGYVSAGQRFMQPQEGEFQIAGFAPQYAPRAIAEQTGQILYSIGSRIAGAVTLGGLGALISPATGVTGAAVGQFAGPALFEAAQIVGPVALERAKNNGYTEPTDEDMAYAITTAAGSGLLNAFGAKYLPGGEKAVGSFSKRLAASFIGEGIPEGLQSLVQQVGETVETKKGIQVSPKQAVGEALIGGGAGAAATIASAPFTPEQIEEQKITERANKEAENLVIGNDNPQGKAVLANKQKLEQEIADAKQVLSAIESTDPIAQKLKLELKEKEAILAAAQGQVDSIVDSNEPVVEAEKQQIELAKAITEPAPKPLPTDVLPTETPGATYGREEQIYDVFGGITRKPVSIPKPAEVAPAAPVAEVAPAAEVAPPTEPTVNQSLTVAQEAPAITPASVEEVAPAISDETKRIEQIAIQSVDTPKKLNARLQDALDTYGVKNRKSWTIDFENKQLISPDKTTAIKWTTRNNPNEPESYTNQQTSTGKANLVKYQPAPVAETPAVTETPAAEVAPAETITMQEASDRGYTQRDPSSIRRFKADKITTDSLTKHLEKNGFQDGDVIETAQGTAEIYVADTGFAYSWKPKKGNGREGNIKDPVGGVKINPVVMRDPNAPSFSVKVEKTSAPKGYVKKGDKYIFEAGVTEQPVGAGISPAEAAKVTAPVSTPAVSETITPAASLLSELGEGWKLDGTIVSKDGFGHWTEKQRDEARAVFNEAGILTNTSTPSGSGNRKSSFTIPSEDARRIQDEIFAEDVKLRKAKNEQAKADEEAKQAEELSRVDPAAKRWMDLLFGRDDFANPANKVHLSDFVTGKTTKFGGMVNPRWFDGVQAAGAVLEGSKVDFQKLKENFENSVTKTAPEVTPAGISVGNRIKLGKSPQTYIVEEVVPQSEVEKANNEQFYSVKNEKTGEVQVVEKADMKQVSKKPKLGQKGGVLIPSREDFIQAGQNIYEAGMEFGVWAKQMIQQFGDVVREFLGEVWQAVSGVPAKLNEVMGYLPKKGEAGAVNIGQGQNAPIEPEAKTITEGLVQGIDIGKENNMPINNKIESHIKNFAFVRGIFESASDRLRRAKFTKLATAIDDYYDQAQRRLGFANKILLPAFDEYSKQSKATKKKIDEEVKRFFAAQENKRDTAEFFDELNPITQKIVTAWQKFGEESGSENQRIGIKVFDKGIQRWRPIGKVEKFWPRVLKPEYQRALMERDKYQKEYNEIVEALMKAGRIQTPEEADIFTSDYQGTGYENDYFSGIESARGQAFPEELYDYSMQVMTDYVARWAQHSSRIEQFGQKLGENSMTLWDKSRASTRDRRTIDYITAAQERVQGAYPNDPIVKGMATLNIWSSGLQLGNPASSMLNFFGGTTLNAMIGQPGALSSYVSSFVELRKLGRELKDAREKGIVSRDLMNIVGDHQAVLDSSGLAKAGQKTTDFLLKWSGFTPIEQMVRTQSMIIGKSFLRKTLSSLSKNPNSSFSKRALTWLNRNNIDADKLIVEQGTGPETDRLLRYFANISQGSYTIAQTPIFIDTPIGRFLFKYQKFSTQVMRQSWKNTFEPAWKAVTNKNETLQLPDQTRQLLYRLRLAEAKELGDNRKITLDEIPKKVTKAEGKALTIIPVMMWLGSAYVGGEVILRMRDMLFGVLMKGPSYEDIIRAFEDDEDDDELYLSLERAWYNLIGMGALGLIGNYAQFFMDWQDRERVKNPLDPPALSIFKETATFIQNAVDQGKITTGDVNNYLNRTFSAYRVSQRLYQTAASGLGYSDAPTVAEEIFRREVASINKYARRWAESAGLEYRTKRPMDIAPSKMTPINREIANYLQRGEPGAAAAYAKEYLKSLPKSERANAIQSMESGARNRQPLRLGSGPMDQAEKIAFKKWLKEKVSKEKFDEIQKLDSQYQKNYRIFLNNLPNK